MATMWAMDKDPHNPKPPRPSSTPSTLRPFAPTDFQPTQADPSREASPQPAKPRVDLDALEQKLLMLREEMRLLHARLETLNLFTRLGVKPGQKPKPR